MAIQVTAHVHMLWNGSHTFNDFHRRLGDGIKEACDLYKARLKQEISKRVQRLRIRGAKRSYRFTIRSKPGEAPRRDTATLWRSIKVSVRRRPDLIGTIWTDIDYAAHLEYGTRFIAPRPAWLPIFLRSYRSMLRIIESKF